MEPSDIAPLQPQPCFSVLTYILFIMLLRVFRANLSARHIEKFPRETTASSSFK